MWLATVLKEREREDKNNRNCKTCVYLIEVDGFKDINTFCTAAYIIIYLRKGHTNDILLSPISSHVQGYE